MKIYTSALIGVPLDWAMATIVWKGRDVVIAQTASFLRIEVPVRPGSSSRFVYAPSTDWSQGGPIREEMGVTSGPWDTSPFSAHLGRVSEVNSVNPRMIGPTELIASMRCIVRFKLGDEVEIPDELLQ